MVRLYQICNAIIDQMQCLRNMWKKLISVCKNRKMCNVMTSEVYCHTGYLKGGDRRVRIFSAHNNWWATPEVSLPLPYQRSAKIFLNFLQQGVKTMYYFKNIHSMIRSR